MPMRITRSRDRPGFSGLGTDQIVSAALDDRRRMDPNRLDETLERLAIARHSDRRRFRRLVRNAYRRV